MIKAVVFDLDDTLIPEIEYVKSGFCAIAKEFGDEKISDMLWTLFEGDRNNVYQRAGFLKEECKRCIEIYRSHKPKLILSDEVQELLLQLKNKGIKLGIITDGRPEGQWNKIYALGLEKVIDKIIVTDELGGEEFRKPNPKAFELMREDLDVEFHEMIYVGDNPTKDFQAPQQLGMQCALVENPVGLYNEERKINSSVKKLSSVKYLIEELNK